MTDFLGSAEIVALQSDGYNAYTFLDNELTDIEHICCMAHVRAKFKYAYDQGKDISPLPRDGYVTSTAKRLGEDRFFSGAFVVFCCILVFM